MGRVYFYAVLSVLWVGVCAANVQAMATLPQYQKTLVKPKSGGDGKETWRHTVYGDSIFSGFCGLLCKSAMRNGAEVESEYLADQWDVNIDHQGRCVAGAVAKQIYQKMQKDVSYMQTANTKVVSFEMCGNDFLRARFKFQNSSSCDVSVLDDALEACKQYMALAMNFINDNVNKNPPGNGGVIKYIMNLYYPGFEKDRQTFKEGCGGRSNMDVFLPYIVRSNWQACDMARQKGFKCADSFAEFMGADFDTHRYGKTDVEGLRYVDGESEDSYVDRITRLLRATLTDAGSHRWKANETYGYIQSDDIHPTYDKKERSLYYVNGHNRIGWALSLFNSALVDVRAGAFRP